MRHGRLPWNDCISQSDILRSVPPSQLSVRDCYGAPGEAVTAEYISRQPGKFVPMLMDQYEEE